MKTYFLVLAICLGLPAQAESSRFPTTPDSTMTPGSLCGHPDSHRYPEQIGYCNRKVSSGTKAQIIRAYDEKFGYEVGKMDRQNFKIDHYIPLCMGGSNQDDNLWPQHVSVGTDTDILEMYECEKMSEGRLRQAEAIDIMKRAKADVSQARELLKYVRGL